MPQKPCSPNLAPTSPTPAGATRKSVLAHRPPPYGGEHAAEPTSDHCPDTPTARPLGEDKGEVAAIHQQQTDLLLSAARAADVLGPDFASDVYAVLIGSPRWLALEAGLDLMDSGRG